MTVYYEKKDGKIIRWTQSERQAVLEKMTDRCADEDLVRAENGDYFLRGEVPETPRERKAEKIRAERNRLLAESDWTQASDCPLSETERKKWRAYRQALRDMPSQTGFPHSVVWPEKE